MKKYISLSNVIYAFSIIFALGVLGKVFLDRYRLPEGVCPTTYNDQWIYMSIGLLVVASVVTTIMDHRSKKAQKSKDESEA